MQQSQRFVNRPVRWFFQSPFRAAVGRPCAVLPERLGPWPSACAPELPSACGPVGLDAGPATYCDRGKHHQALIPPLDLQTLKPCRLNYFSGEAPFHVPLFPFGSERPRHLRLGNLLLRRLRYGGLPKPGDITFCCGFLQLLSGFRQRSYCLTCPRHRTRPRPTMDGPRARLLSSTRTTDNVRNAAGAVPTKNNDYQPPQHGFRPPEGPDFRPR